MNAAVLVIPPPTNASCGSSTEFPYPLAYSVVGIVVAFAVALAFVYVNRDDMDGLGFAAASFIGVTAGLFWPLALTFGIFGGLLYAVVRFIRNTYSEKWNQ